MNTKILSHVLENLRAAFNLDRWTQIRDSINCDTDIIALPWTPKRREKFVAELAKTFDVDVRLQGRVIDLVQDIDHQYSARFWGGGVWQPRTDVYQYTGWNIVDEINQRNPRRVLDVGCGYNQFKPRIQNLIGIDKFNNSADYMVDILDFHVDPESFDAAIVFGSINFGDYQDMSARYHKVFSLLAPSGRIYVRANPGHGHTHGPWIDIFPWTFEHAHRIAKENAAELVTFKQDNGDRLHWIYEKK
jgi:SAM-dependent methyltransferase